MRTLLLFSCFLFTSNLLANLNLDPKVEVSKDEIIKYQKQQLEYEREKETKEECNTAFEAIQDARSKLDEVCPGENSVKKCQTNYKQCNDCMSSLSTPPKRSRRGRIPYREYRNKQAKCHSDRTDRNSRRGRTFMDSFLEANQSGTPGQPLSFTRHQPRKRDYSKQIKLYKSCPVINSDKLEKFVEDNKSHQEKIEELQETINELKQAAIDAQNEEAKAKQIHEDNLKKEKDKHNEGTERLKLQLSESQKTKVDRRTQLIDALSGIDQNIADQNLRKKQAKQQLESQIKQQRFACLDRAQALLDQRVSKRIEDMQRGTHSTKNINSFYSKVRDNNFKSDRRYLKRKWRECLNGDRYKETKIELQRIHKEVTIPAINREIEKQQNLKKTTFRELKKIDYEIQKEIPEHRIKLEELALKRKEAELSEAKRYQAEALKLSNNTLLIGEKLSQVQAQLKRYQSESSQLLEMIEIAESKRQAPGKDIKSIPASVRKYEATLDSASNICNCGETGEIKNRCKTIKGWQSESGSSDDKDEDSSNSGTKGVN